MPEIIHDPDRQVIPRWRSFAATGVFGELAPLRMRPTGEFTVAMLEHVLEDWRREPSLSVAADVVSSAITIGQTGAAREAAEFVLADEKAPALARELASRCIEGGDTVPSPPDRTNPAQPGDEHSIRIAIHQNRDRLRSYPINPVLWTNQALLYTTLGDRMKAEQAMRVAQSLAPDNRFVVRAACRLYLHTGDEERAHSVLLRSAGIQSDPWLIAGELAVSAIRKKPSHNVRRARRMIETEQYPPFHLSELTGALATMEAHGGNRRKARRLSEQSLRDPSENAIAQAAWFNRFIGETDWEPPTSARVQSSEANAWVANVSGEWETSLDEAKRWIAEQPFSSRPAIFGGYLASTIFEDWAQAEGMLQRGLKSNRGDPVLYNNLAFSLAHQGKVDEATLYVREGWRVASGKRCEVFLTATQGLIAFRSGLPDIGRLLYRKAILTAERDPALHQAGRIARVYLAIEEMRIGTPEAVAAQKAASDGIDKLPSPYREVFVSKLEAAASKSRREWPLGRRT